MADAPVIASPGFAAPAGRILFILEVQNSLERGLLEDCLDEVMRDRLPDDLGRVALRLAGDTQVARLDELAARLNAPDDTLLVPARVSWLVPGGSEETKQPLPLRHLLFGDPRHPGGIRGRWIRWRDPQRAQCIHGAPATLGELRARFESGHDKAAAAEPGKFAAFVARQAGLALEIAEWGLIGRRYKAPRFIAESLDGSPGFQAALRDLAVETGRPVAELQREAAGYLRELVAEPNTLFIDLRARFDNWVLSLGYDRNVECRQEDLERLRSIVQTHPAMLLFTHKTYIDSIALTARLFESDFPMLHIFGGLNMGFAGLGLLMRRSGGIFIRRSFQDKPLYKLVLRHYIGFLMEKRFPMTWAFEGTRSRTGKLMPPRYGLLKYVLEAAYVTGARNVHVVPVTVSYDLMRDVSDYASEQTGRVKKPETLKWFLGYLSSLKQPMGRMYLDFGEAVVLEHPPEPDDRMALSKIAFEVAVQANRVTPITLPAIGCMVLMGAAPRALTLRELQRGILGLLRWARARGIRLTSDFSPERLGHIRELTRHMVEMGLLIRYDEGSDTVFGIEPSQHPVASYYRNTIIHHFVNKAILELALLGVEGAGPPTSLESFWNQTSRLRDLFKFEFFYPKKKEFRLRLQQELRRVDPAWRERLEQGEAGARALLAEMQPLVAHASLLQFVEAYSVVFDLLARLDPAEGMESEDCIARALRQGQQAYLQRRITSEASIGKILFANGYRLAANLGLTGGRSGSEAEALRGQRSDLLAEFKELARRLDQVRLLALAADTARPARTRKHAAA